MKKFALIGNPVEHSLSPLLHNYCFKKNGFNSEYISILLEDAKDLKKTIISSGLSGANITYPFKEAAFDICDELSNECISIGSVNTIVVKEGKLFGLNWDGEGFLHSISDFNDISNALIIGAGGSAKAIAHSLKKSSISVDIINRSKERLNSFSNKGFNCFTPSDFNPKKYDLIINTTPAGLKNEEFPICEKLLRTILKDSRYCVDIIYNKKTPFLKLCEEFNIQSIDGSGMLTWQAALSHCLFIDGSFTPNEIRSDMNECLK